MEKQNTFSKRFAISFKYFVLKYFKYINVNCNIFI